jgi:hypothetical protein
MGKNHKLSKVDGESGRDCAARHFPLKFQKVAEIFYNHFLGQIVISLVTLDGWHPPNQYQPHARHS